MLKVIFYYPSDNDWSEMLSRPTVKILIEAPHPDFVGTGGSSLPTACLDTQILL